MDSEAGLAENLLFQAVVYSFSKNENLAQNGIRVADFL